MDKLVVLTLMGELDRDIWVRVQVSQESGLDLGGEEGRLPPCPELITLYESWQSTLRSFVLPGFRMKGKIIIKDNSIVEQFDDRQRNHWCRNCRAQEQDLHELMNDWLRSDSFRPIREKLNQTVLRGDRVRVLLCSSNPQIKKLPWNLWDLLGRNQRQAEVILSKLSYQPRTPTLRKKVRILIILGNSEGINPETDLQILIEKLRNKAEIIPPLVNPTQQQLTHYLWNETIDILYFAGHSQTEQGIGQIYINDTDVIEIKDLKYALEKAMSHGLKLAIFNSCDGLGLAYELEELDIPNLIVMRDIVHEKVAQQFLSDLLKSFVIEKKPLHLAEQEARKKLQGLEAEFPCASWMPVIFQHYSDKPQYWQDWFRRYKPRPWSEIIKVVAVSLAITILIMWVRSLGVLEPSELWAYDRFMELRPQNETPDTRLLIVGVTEKDLQKWGKDLPKNNQEKVLSNQAIIQLLKAINKYQPRIIGLDIFRDKDFLGDLKGYAELIDYLKQQDKQIISICKIGKAAGTNYPEVAPPEGVDGENLGYANFANNPGEIVRNHSLSRKVETGDCTPNYSLSLRLASRFLGQEEISIKSDSLSIGTHLIKVLSGNSGGYQTKQSKDVLQITNPILINYRATDKVAEQVTVTKVLNGSINPKFVKDKLVLIGYVDGRDEHFTPYSYKYMSGVVIHAHMVSQLISFIMDRRPLIQSLPNWGEIFWIFGWALTGGILAWQFRLLRLEVFGGIAFIILCVGSFWLFNEAFWVPFIPASLAFIGTGSMIIIYIKSLE